MESFELLYLKKCHVLLVEDDNDARHIMTESLKVIFDTIDTASNGEVAFKLYSQNKPDIVLSDISMPFGDGLTLAEKIRTKDLQTAIILISAYTQQEYLLRSSNLQLDGYILKPMTLDKLFDVLSRALKRLLLHKKYYNS